MLVCPQARNDDSSSDHEGEGSDGGTSKSEAGPSSSRTQKTKSFKCVHVFQGLMPLRIHMRDAAHGTCCVQLGMQWWPHVKCFG